MAQSTPDPRLASVDPALLAMRDATLAKNSRRHYIAMLILLQKLVDKPVLRLIVDAEDTIQRVKERYPDTNTRKTLVVAVKAALKHVPSLKAQVPEDRVQPWTEFFKEMKSESVRQSMCGEKNEKQRRAWVDWGEIVAACGRQAPYSKAHLLLCVYTMVPPLRHDYGNVRVFQRDEDVPQGYAGNYLVMASRRFVLQIYKTRPSMGVFCKIWPVNLMRVVRETLRLHPRQYLFEKSPGKPFGTTNEFKQFSTPIFKKTLGKNVSVNIIRHSFISNLDFNKLRPCELAAIASDMRHSLEQQQQYRLPY